MSTNGNKNSRKVVVSARDSGNLNFRRLRTGPAIKNATRTAKQRGKRTGRAAIMPQTETVKSELMTKKRGRPCITSLLHD
jgi:hypothetical protein